MKEPPKIIAVILAGGYGKRLRPYTGDTPKQFARLPGEQVTFIQSTVLRLKPLVDEVIIVTTTEHQQELAEAQVVPLGIPAENILRLAPEYDYAGAMLEVAKIIYEKYGRVTIINSPADHLVGDLVEFEEAIGVTVAHVCNTGRPTIVGVKSTDLTEATACGHFCHCRSDDEIGQVVNFIEKPCEKDARRLIERPDAACNTGILVWDSKEVATLLADLDTKGLSTQGLMHALLEKCCLDGTVRRLDWHDCGTLPALYDVCQKDEYGNVFISKGNNVTAENALFNCQDSFVSVGDGKSLYVNGGKSVAVTFNNISGKPTLIISDRRSDGIGKLMSEIEEYGCVVSGEFMPNNTSRQVHCVGSCRDRVTVAFVGAEANVVVIGERCDRFSAYVGFPT